MIILRDDDIYLTESPTDGTLFYDFEKFKEVHELIAGAGLIHTLAICAGEIENHPELTFYILNRKEEFDFGIHGWMHEKYSTWLKENIKSSLFRSKAVIEAVFGVEVKWFFPPWNKRSPEMFEACKELGLKVNDEWMTLTDALNGKKEEVIGLHYWNNEEVKQLKLYVQRQHK